MNPVELELRLGPIFGTDIARAFARVAEVHKNQAAVTVSVPSWVLVRVAERIIELTQRSNES